MTKAEKAEYDKRYRAANLERLKAQNKARYEARDRVTHAAKERSKYQRNRAAILLKAKIRAAHRADKIRAYQAVYRAANKALMRDYFREKYLANKQAVVERSAAWAKRHPDAGRSNARNRRARIKGNGGRHSETDILALFASQRGLCVACQCDLSLRGYHVDHIHPLSRGGSNGADNLQLLCPRCNQNKCADSMDEFMRRRRVASEQPQESATGEGCR